MPAKSLALPPSPLGELGPWNEPTWGRSAATWSLAQMDPQLQQNRPAEPAQMSCPTPLPSHRSLVIGINDCFKPPSLGWVITQLQIS